MTKYDREAVGKMSDDELYAEIEKVDRQAGLAWERGDEVESDRLTKQRGTVV